MAEEDDRMSKSGMFGVKMGESDSEWLVEGVNESGSLSGSCSASGLQSSSSLV